MDFGDILNKWEKSQNKNPMEKILANREIFNKDADSHKKSNPGAVRRRLLNQEPDDIIDIHGLTSDEAWIALEKFFENAKSNNYKKVRIIHGKGNNSQGKAILGNIVQKFIEQCSYAGESGFEKAPNGGSGAAWVLLKYGDKDF